MSYPCFVLHTDVPYSIVTRACMRFKIVWFAMMVGHVAIALSAKEIPSVFCTQTISLCRTGLIWVLPLLCIYRMCLSLCMQRMKHTLPCLTKPQAAPL